MNNHPPEADPAREVPVSLGFVPEPSSRNAMSGECLQQSVTIVNPQGFHMRPQKAFAQLAQQFQCAVTVAKDDRRVNGKSLFELLLMSVPQGTELVIEATGSDARQALDALAELLATPFPDDDLDASSPPKG
jgi:phosphocarrier protein HPr